MDNLKIDVVPFLAYLATLGYLRRWNDQYQVLEEFLLPLDSASSR